MSEIGGGLRAEETPAEDEPPRPDARGARWLRRHLAGGVAVLTTAVDDGYRGATVTACMFVSAEPLLLLVALEQDNQMLEWITECRSFAVSVLPWREQFLADQFAGFTPRASRSFAGIPFEVGESGCPTFTGAIVWADCSLQDTISTGDHHCLIGHVTDLGTGHGDPDDPLVYYRNRYRRFS